MDDSTVQPLSSVKHRQRALIVSLTGERQLQGRLVDMGLHVGSEVEILRPSNGTSGPALVASGETRLALGYGMASQILVAIDPT